MAITSWPKGAGRDVGRGPRQFVHGGLAGRAVPALVPPGRQGEQVGLGHDPDHLAVLGGDRETADPVLTEHDG
jgi:hypothetical protein